MPLHHLQHFLIQTEDLEKTKDWFVDVLGMKVGPAPDFKFPVYWLYLGDADVLHITAEHDHLVPQDCAKALIANVGSDDKEEVMLKGGHVSLVAGPNAIKRMWPKLDQWLGARCT